MRRDAEEKLGGETSASAIDRGGDREGGRERARNRREGRGGGSIRVAVDGSVAACEARAFGVRGGSRAGNWRDLDANSKEKKTPEGKQTPSNATRIDEPSVSTPVRPSDEAKSVFIQTLHDARL
jgi:hypothetical protein